MENKLTIKTPGRYRLQYRGVHCLNCGHPLDLSDKYCPNCSQANSTKKLTLFDYLEEFLSNILEYDSKLFQTLTALLLKPGKITREYIQGKRLSYTNPFRFLFSLAFIYFLLMGLENDFENLNINTGKNTIDTAELKKEINSIEFKNEQVKKNALTALDSLKLDRTIQTPISQQDSTILSDPEAYFNSLNQESYFSRLGSKIEFFRTLIKKDSVFTFEETESKYNIPKIRENEITFRLSKNIAKIKERPESFLNEIISKLPFATFFFIPVFTIFVWLVYIRKKYTYTDHLIFSFHNQALLFILLIVSYLVNKVFNIDSELIFLLIFSIYLYKAMRNFYQQGRIKTILKYVFLNFIFIILGVVAIITLLMESIFTYS